MITISEMTKDDFEEFWPTFKAIAETEETYAFDPAITYEAAYTLWCEVPQHTYAAKENGVLLGSCYLKPNAAGPGGHVCNSGFMVCEAARGKGVATALCKHAQAEARRIGYTAMQFNMVVAANTVAVNLWKSLGFAVIGRVPGGYHHKTLGVVDLLIMHKDLA